MTISRYALKQELRSLRLEVSRKTGIKVSMLAYEYGKWLAHQYRSVGRAEPKGRTEEIACELVWLKEKLKSALLEAAE